MQWLTKSRLTGNNWILVESENPKEAAKKLIEVHDDGLPSNETLLESVDVEVKVGAGVVTYAVCCEVEVTYFAERKNEIPSSPETQRK
jgi:hypothetical protein